MKAPLGTVRANVGAVLFACVGETVCTAVVAKAHSGMTCRDTGLSWEEPLYTHISICLHQFTRIHVCMCVYIHINIYIRIHIHIQIHIHTYSHFSFI